MIFHSYVCLPKGKPSILSHWRSGRSGSSGSSRPGRLGSAQKVSKGVWTSENWGKTMENPWNPQVDHHLSCWHGLKWPEMEVYRCIRHIPHFQTNPFYCRLTGWLKFVQSTLHRCSTELPRGTAPFRLGRSSVRAVTLDIMALSLPGEKPRNFSSRSGNGYHWRYVKGQRPKRSIRNARTTARTPEHALLSTVLQRVPRRLKFFTLLYMLNTLCCCCTASCRPL